MTFAVELVTLWLLDKKDVIKADYMGIYNINGIIRE